MPKPETPDDPAPQPPTPILPGAPQEEINAFFPPSDAAPAQPSAECFTPLERSSMLGPTSVSGRSTTIWTPT